MTNYTISTNFYDPDQLWIQQFRDAEPAHFSLYKAFKTAYSRFDVLDMMIAAGYESVFSTNNACMNFIKGLSWNGISYSPVGKHWEIVTLNVTSDEDEDGGSTCVSPQVNASSLSNERDVGANIFHITILAGDHNDTLDLLKKFVEKFDLKPRLDPDALKTDWTYLDGKGGIQTSEMEVKPPPHISPVLYPYIKDFDTFLDRFNSSQAPILILLGPPGTGKTTFIRYLLHKNKWKSMLAYEAALMTQDSYYIQFLQNSSTKCMILEDADILLQSRIEKQNPVMSKLLNVSDGLLQFHKKFIFTANLANIDEVDHALTRPGRCFEVINFRELNLEEALKVAEEFDLRIDPTKENYSLSELFNNKQDFRKIHEKQKIGFR